MVFTVLTIILLIGLLSYYIIFSRIKLSSFDLENNHFSAPISVIICAKNELENIKSFFPSWINQKYTNFELIIVDDQSTDGSNEYLKALALQHQNLTIVSIPKGLKKELKGKRHALWQGILASKNNYLFFTDADCKPSENWLQEMSKAFADQNTEIVLGYSPYFEEKTFLNKLVQYETLMTGLQYLGFAAFGLPYMSVGRNVAYKKTLLTEKAFKNSNKSKGGDDDLVFQQLANKKNVAYCITEASRVYSLAPKTFKEWIAQKKRHLTAGNHYSIKLKIILGLFSSLNLLFTLSIFLALFESPIIVFFTILIKYISFSFIVKRVIHKLPTKIFFITDYSIIDIVYWFFYIIFVLVSII